MLAYVPSSCYQLLEWLSLTLHLPAPPVMGGGKKLLFPSEGSMLPAQ